MKSSRNWILPLSSLLIFILLMHFLHFILPHDLSKIMTWRQWDLKTGKLESLSPGQLLWRAKKTFSRILHHSRLLLIGQTVSHDHSSTNHWQADGESISLIKQPLRHWILKKIKVRSTRKNRGNDSWQIISIICCVCKSGNHNMTFTHEEEVLCQSMGLQKNFKVSDLLIQLKIGFTYLINISYV